MTSFCSAIFKISRVTKNLLKDTLKAIRKCWIAQWIVRNEASATKYPPPAPEEVDRSLQRLKSSFSSPEEFERRGKLSGLTIEDINCMLAPQLYLSNSFVC